MSTNTSATTEDEKSSSSDQEETRNTNIWYFNFEDLPFEIRVHILMYLSDRVLSKFGTVSKFYHSLILGNDNEDEFAGYRNTIWKEILLHLFNRWIDEINSSTFSNGIDSSELEKLTANSLDSYIKRNFIMKERFGYRHLLSYLKSIKYKTQNDAKRIKSDTGVMINKRTVRNNNVKEWNCFLCKNYYLTKTIDDKSNIPITLKGYEIIIQEYYLCANTWRLVYGVGTDFENFNSDTSSTQFLSDNHGVGLVIEHQYVKSKGSLKSDTTQLMDLGPINVGDRYALTLDFNNLSINFFKNGLHFMTFKSALDPNIIYNPIIALCPKKTVTLFPLFADYPFNPNAPVR